MRLLIVEDSHTCYLGIRSRRHVWGYGCGHCPACQEGKFNCCETLKVLGVHTAGGMAEEIVLPAINVYPATGISLRDAAMVEFLAIGTELSKMTRGRTSRWEIIIRDIRVVYRGRLVYAANWGNEVKQVGFWPLLDFIGVDFYYPISSEDSPSDEALRQGFESSLRSLRALSRRLSKPVLRRA